MDENNKPDFVRLCKVLRLGSLTGNAEPVLGGLLHKMYKMTTTQGVFAVKALNPQIMLRPAAMNNTVESERIAAKLSETVPALPALKFNGSAVQDVGGRYYLIYNWVNGRSLKPEEIKPVHCETIGLLIAKIHKTDLSCVNIADRSGFEPTLIDWNGYLKKGRERDSVWAERLDRLIFRLIDCNVRANEVSRQLNANKVISHRDLDAKNVLWVVDKPVIIDWESAGYTSSPKDLTGTAFTGQKMPMEILTKINCLRLSEVI